MSRDLLFRRPSLFTIAGRIAAPAKLCLRSMPDSNAGQLGSLPAQVFETAHRRLRPATTKKRLRLLTAAPGRPVKSP
jgi:hypothetical protein